MSRRDLLAVLLTLRPTKRHCFGAFWSLSRQAQAPLPLHAARPPCRLCRKELGGEACAACACARGGRARALSRRDRAGRCEGPRRPGSGGASGQRCGGRRGGRYGLHRAGGADGRRRGADGKPGGAGPAAPGRGAGGRGSRRERRGPVPGAEAGRSQRLPGTSRRGTGRSGRTWAPVRRAPLRAFRQSWGAGVRAARGAARGGGTKSGLGGCGGLPAARCDVELPRGERCD